MKEKGFAPIIILLVLVGIGLLTYFGLFYKSSTQPFTTLTNTPAQSGSQSTADPNVLNWITKEWYVPGNFEEFPIPNITYSIEYPSTWKYNNDSETAKDCFKIKIIDPINIMSVDIDAVCTSWGQVDDKTSLPKDYKLVKRSEEELNKESSFKFLVRIKKASGNYTYIQGQNSKDDTQSAFFTNAVMIEENTATKNTHSYFTASNILVKYSGSNELTEEYLEIADKIISSLIIKSVNFNR